MNKIAVMCLVNELIDCERHADRLELAYGLGETQTKAEHAQARKEVKEVETKLSNLLDTL